MTFSAGGTRSATAALASPIRDRNSNTSTSPSVPPSTSTVPVVGNNWAAATWSKVVLPAPLGPITTHRSSAWAVQSMSCINIDFSRRTPTPRNRSTSSDIGRPFLLWLRPRRTYRGKARAVFGAGRRVAFRPRKRCRVPDGVQRGLRPVLHAEFGQHRADVRFHRFLRHVEYAGDLPVGSAPGDVVEHLALAAGERVHAADRAALRTPLDQRSRRFGRQQHV